MRADFYGWALRHRPLAEALQNHQENLGPMNREELQAAIVRPAENAGVAFEPGMVETLLDTVASKPGGLPLLQFALREMWGRQERKKITRKSYDEIGGVEGALAVRAETVFAGLTRNGADAAMDKAFQRLFTRLVTLGEGQEDTRRVVERAELGDEVWGLAQRLAGEENRLVVTNASTTHQTAEVVHEALIRHWPKLVDWINRDRTFQLWLRQIKSNVELWSADPTDEGPLLRGGMLVQATEWLALRRDDLSPKEQAYIEASTALQETVRGRAQRVRAAIYVLLVGIIGSLLGVIFKDEIGDLWFEQTTLRRYIAANVTPHVRTPEAERALKPGDTFRECAQDCPEMVVVPPGEFWMGSRDGEGNSAAEYPRHKVRIDRPFAVGKFEITWDDWQACVETRGCDGRPTGDSDFGKGRRPVINVSWDQAKAYVAWLSRMTGKPYRLLSEAEWEYAARGVTSADAPHPPFPWGDNASHEYANYGTDQCCDGKTEGRDAWFNTAPVGQFPANAFGLHDVHGNVWEWVEDPWHDNYRGSPPTNGSAWTEGGDESRRVHRGGSWFGIPQNLRSAARIRNSADLRIYDLGFRVGRTLTP